MEFDTIVNRIKPLLKTRPCTLEELIRAAEPVDEDKVIRALRWLTDNEKITFEKDNKYQWDKR